MATRWCAASELDDVEGGVETVVNAEWVAAVDAHTDRCAQASHAAACVQDAASTVEEIERCIVWNLQWDVQLQLDDGDVELNVVLNVTVFASSLSGGPAACFDIGDENESFAMIPHQVS